MILDTILSTAFLLIPDPLADTLQLLSTGPFGPIILINEAIGLNPLCRTFDGPVLAETSVPS